MTASLGGLYGGAASRQMLALFPSGSGVLLPFLAVIGLQGLFWIGSDGTGYLAQRAMACRSDADARAAGVLFAWVQILVRSLLWLVIGLGLLVLYPFTPAEAAAAREAAVFVPPPRLLEAGRPAEASNGFVPSESGPGRAQQEGKQPWRSRPAFIAFSPPAGHAA